MKRAWIISLCVVVAIPLLVLAGINATLFFFTTDKGKQQLSALTEQYLDNRLQIEDLDYSLIKTFPTLGISLQNATLTADTDTVVSIKNADIQFRWTKLISKNTIFFDKLLIDSSSVNIHMRADSSLNLKMRETESNDTASQGALPRIIIKNGQLNHIRFAYKNDTDSTSVVVNDLEIQARSLISDTIFARFSIATPRITFRNKQLSVDSIPLRVEGKAAIRKDFELFGIKRLEIESDLLQANLEGRITHQTGNDYLTNLDWQLNIDSLSDINELSVAPYKQHLSKILLQGTLQMNGSVHGVWGDKNRPTIDAAIALKEASMAIVGAKKRIDTLALYANTSINFDNHRTSFADIEQLNIKSGSSYLQIAGRIDSLFHENHIQASSNIYLQLDYLKDILPKDIFSVCKGEVRADIAANLKLSDLKRKEYGKIISKAEINTKKIQLKSEKLDLNAFSDNLHWEFGTNSIALKRSKKVAFFVSRLAFDSISLHYQQLIKKCRISRFDFNCHADNLKTDVPNLRTSLTLNGIRGVFDTVFVSSKKTRVSFVINKDKTDTLIPYGKLRFFTDSLLIGTPLAGMRFDSTQFVVETKPRVRQRFRASKRKSAEENSNDSLQWIYAKANRRPMTLDSLYRLTNLILQSSEPSDLFLKKFRNKGEIKMKELRIRTPYFQLPISSKNMGLTFTDDTLHLRNFRLNIGQSDLTFDGNATNMRRAFLRGRTLSGKLNLYSKKLNINELLNAYQKGGERFKSEHAPLLQDETPTATADTINSEMKLFVVPEPFDLAFKTTIDTLIFSDILFNDFYGDVTMREKILRIKNLSTSTNLGHFAMNVMYKCDTPQKATAGVDISTKKIDVDQLIKQIPMLDSIVPMLRSFDGQLDCSMTAVTDLDSAMNVDLPTLSAAAYLHGEDMVLLDGETFSEIAKTLMFKNKKRNLIDSISVELTIKNNQMEVYPFMLEMDKYRAAISGTHNFDMSFNYHISLLNPLKIGLNIYGNLEKPKFKLVLPKYKDEKSVTRSTSLQGKTLNLRQQFQKSLQQIILEQTN